MNMKQPLLRLCEKYELELNDPTWMFEDDRWAELVFCLLHQRLERNPETVRSVITLLADLELLKPEVLTALKDESSTSTVLIAHVLRIHSFSDEEVQTVRDLLCHLVEVIGRTYAGQLHRFIRSHGEKMRNELVSVLATDLLEDQQLRQATSHWLQNTLNMPISLESQSVVNYCRKHDASLEDLWQAADDLGLNLALVDDLIELDANQQNLEPS